LKENYQEDRSRGKRQDLQTTKAVHVIDIEF